MDDGDAAGEFGETFLEFLFVVVRGRGLDLSLDLLDAGSDLIFGAGALDDDGLVLGDLDLGGAAELIDRGSVQFQTEVGGDDGAAGEDGDILEHLFASVAEARGFDGNTGEGAADLVEEQRGEGFAFDVLGNDDELLTGLDDGLEQREDLLDVGDLLIGDEDERVFDLGDHLLGIGGHVRRQVTAVELHAFDDVAGGFRSLGLLDGDDAVGGHFVHGVGDQLTDIFIGGRDGRDSGDVGRAGDRFGVGLDGLDGGVDSGLDALLDDHRVGTGGDVLHAFTNEGLRQKRCGGGTVTGDVVGLGGDFLDELRAHVLERVFELDFLRDGDTVVGDQRCAVFAVKNDVSALRAERDLDGVGKFVDTGLKSLAGLFTVNDLFCHCVLPLLFDFF